MGTAPSGANSQSRLSNPTDHFDVSINKAGAPIAEQRPLPQRKCARLRSPPMAFGASAVSLNLETLRDIAIQ